VKLPFPPSEVLQQVDRIAESKTFGQSSKLAGFLRFTVNEALSGRADGLKEYLIGIEVYNRPHDYNPKADSIVRSEAVRLRSKLQTYYATEGVQDKVRIEYPKGTYAPVVELRGKSTPTLAVLPLVNTGGAPEDEFFADGLTDNLIAALARVPGLRVIARTSVFQFKAKVVDVREIGRRLNAGMVLEGSVRRSQQRLRVHTRLIDVETGSHVWSETFNREWTDVFEVQDEISESVAMKLAREFAHRPAIHGTNDVEAYHLFLKGRYCFHKWTVEEVQKSFSWFEQAIERDPNYGKAWAAIGDSHSILAFWGVSPEIHAPAAHRALVRALELDGELVEAEAVYAQHLAAQEWQWEEAERRFRRLTERHPGCAEGHHLYAVACLIPQGRLEEAAASIHRTLELDPLFLGAHVQLGRILYLAGRPQDAIRQHLRTLELDSGFREAHWQLGLAYEAAGDFGNALSSFGRALSSGSSPNAWGSLGHCQAKSGNAAEARRYQGLLRESGENPVVTLPARALIHCGMGETEAAIQCLEDSFVTGSRALLRLKTDPRFAPLHAEPRFHALLARMGLATRDPS
jgi:serine/threonine-protein kinase